jgi:iron complex transport system ATP-binding protein
MISAIDLTYRYGVITALDRASLDITAGAFTGIIGPNGSGKSTLLCCLAGILSPASGRVLLEGRPLDRYGRRDVSRKVALVFQDNFFPFDFTAAEVVLMGRSPYLGALQDERPQDREQVRQAMDACDCWHLRDRSIRALSGGERQRVVLARALAQSTSALLMDEPTNHLDLRHQSLILGLVRERCRTLPLAAAGVFHDLNLAIQFCDRLALMDRGRVVAVGTASEVVTPKNILAAYRTDIELIRHPKTRQQHVVFSNKLHPRTR